jgi:hypothetical protein
MTMNRPHDEGIPADRVGDVLTLRREESPEVPEMKSFSQPDPTGKPLVAFETLPVHTAAPLTWGSGNS